MKKILAIIMCLLYTSMVYSTIYEYVDKSGRSFFYIISQVFYKEGDKRETADEIDFVRGQAIKCTLITNDLNYSEEEMENELKLMFRDSILVLYNKNVEYMEKNFPEYTYTFDEVYNFTLSVSSLMTWLGYPDCTCQMSLELFMPRVIQNRKEEVDSHPYILGYLYQEEKYLYGKKCKLTQLSGVRIN